MCRSFERYRSVLPLHCWLSSLVSGLTLTQSSSLDLFAVVSRDWLDLTPPLLSFRKTPAAKRNTLRAFLSPLRSDLSLFYIGGPKMAGLKVNKEFHGEWSRYGVKRVVGAMFILLASSLLVGQLQWSAKHSGFLNPRIITKIFFNRKTFNDLYDSGS